ncbi:MAG: GTPase [Deltaproteobacteria bacterium]|nr:GTPase [Deltaproteobacteria bacterium]
MLHGNKLVVLPHPIYQLTNLSFLFLYDCALEELSPEISKLKNLEQLVLHGNRLIRLPPQLGQLTKLSWLPLHNNPLASPPLEIVEQGTEAVLAYLREQLGGNRRQWVSKLLVVGEGGVGKTALLCSLRGRSFDPLLGTTHGIETSTLELAHPTADDVSMQLNTWDFGGQVVYHATHQFFLTNRSLFLLAWNALHGFENGKLYYWLDALQARAPESPVLLVATWIDERHADLPLGKLRAAYPQIVGHCEISNKTGEGIEALRTAIADCAALLPLMGELWPDTWLTAAEDIRAREEKYITPPSLREIMGDHGVSGDNTRILAQWLHELGDILYFQDDEELKDLVILKPHWVTGYINTVLESKEVIKRSGVLTRAHRDKLWADLPPALRDHFLCFMERFDLSYRAPENRDRSIVVERLPLDPPDYGPQWDAVKKRAPCDEISMKFQLNTLPAGIPGWFIARSRRFHTGTQWRNGALLARDAEQRHLALVQAFPQERYLELIVRGPSPRNFFSLLRDGIEVTLARFPGLNMERLLPCPGHGGEPCKHAFKYEHLLRRLEKKYPRYSVECPEAEEFVDVRTLLFGLEPCAHDDVFRKLKKAAMENPEEEAELLALLQREFAKSFRQEQSKIELHCPHVFVLRPVGTGTWKDILFGGKIQLQLYCQAPGCWHPPIEGGNYTLDNREEWFQKVGPYIQIMSLLLKFVSPLLGPWVQMASKDYEELIRQDVERMNKLTTILRQIMGGGKLSLAKSLGQTLEGEILRGAALRALRNVLDRKDPDRHWGGLKKVLTPEGHYLWLCECHAEEYGR